MQNNNYNLNDHIIKLIMFICIVSICAMLLYRDSDNQLGIITFSSLVSFSLGLTINPSKINENNK